MGISLLLVLSCFVLGSTAFFFKSSPVLEKYNVDPESLTVSGISSGGAFATQFHFAYSDIVKGAGVFAGGPFLCAYGNPLLAATCMQTPWITGVSRLNVEAELLATAHTIDSTKNLNGSKVYIFHGSNDIVVRPGSGKNLKEMYDHFDADVHAEFNIPANHGQPVDGNGFGGPCSSLNILKSFVNECGYNGAYEMFNFLYGNGQNLTRPNETYVEDGYLLDYNQKEFFSLHPSLSSMSTSGMIYVPKACKDGSVQCRFHIAFHGCMANEHLVGEGFARKTQYMEVASLNNIIVMFPQTTSTVMSPTACWDWFGYTGLLTYPTKAGNQMAGVYKMMNRVMFGK